MSAAQEGLWSQPQVVGAIIALGGVVGTILVREVIVTLYLAYKKRREELADKAEQAEKDHKNLVRRYGDPLKQAVVSLKWRLDEIIVKKKGKYLLADAADIPFFEYKRLSTLYRFAALLGWIRAIQIEQSYLDPKEPETSDEMQAVADLQSALADGHHVEEQRLTELGRIWCVTDIPVSAVTHIAHAINAQCAQYLAEKNVLAARDLDAGKQLELAERCAGIVRQHAGKDIPSDIVKATVEQASVIFGIKEAYIYRDWQAAIGDLMLQRLDGEGRRYSVIGYGVFEDLYIAASQGADERKMKRWFDRLSALTYDLKVEEVGIFDARHEQVQKIHKCCEVLESALNRRTQLPMKSAKRRTISWPWLQS